MSFQKIEKILESELPAEAKQTARWWWNIKDSKKAKSWLDYGYYTYDIKNMHSRGKVCFKRTEKKPKLQRGFSRIWYFLTDKDAESHKKVLAVLEILIPVLTLIIGILTLYVTIFPAKSQNQIKEDFDSFVREGAYVFLHKDYLEAASYFRQAYLIAYDTSSEAYSLYLEGCCYMYYGSAENDKYYLDLSSIILENIVNTSKYENTEIYQPVIITLGLLYGISGYDWQDEKWCSIVEQLETMYNFDDPKILSEVDVKALAWVATDLSLYYGAILVSNSNVWLLDEDYQLKAIYYTKKAIMLEEEYNKYYGVDYNYRFLISIFNVTYYMISNVLANPNDNMLDTLEEARTMCQFAISTIDLESENMLQLDYYIKLKTNIARSYWVASLALKSPDKEGYLIKAYQELNPLFYWDNYEVGESILVASKCILLTKQCTENDIQLILNRLLLYLESAKESNDIQKQIRIEVETVMVCYNILTYYDYEDCNFVAQELGRQLWTDLNTVLFDFLESNQKDELKTCSEVFGS